MIGGTTKTPRETGFVRTRVGRPLTLAEKICSRTGRTRGGLPERARPDNLASRPRGDARIHRADAILQFMTGRRSEAAVRPRDWTT